MACVSFEINFLISHMSNDDMNLRRWKFTAERVSEVCENVCVWGRRLTENFCQFQAVFCHFSHENVNRKPKRRSKCLKLSHHY